MKHFHIRCLVTFGVLWLFITVLWVGLQCVIVVFPIDTHLPFFVLSHYFKVGSPNGLGRVYPWGLCVCVCVWGGGYHAIPRKYNISHVEY